MATAETIVSAALRKISVIAAGETPSSEDADIALEALNAMIDTWRIEEMMIYAFEMDTFDLVNGQRVYTMGTGGDFDVDRPPVMPIAAKLRIPNQQDLPLAILDQQEYASLILKDTQSTIAGAINIDGAYPLRNVTMWPVPSDDDQQLLLWNPTVLEEFASLGDDVILPPGYRRALIFNLALEVASEFERNPPQAVVAIANDSKAWVKRANHVPRKMQMPAELVTAQSRYNIFTDGTV